MKAFLRQRQTANWIVLWTVICFLSLSLVFSGVNSASAASQELTLYNHWTAGWAFDFSRGEAFSFWDNYDDDSYSMDLCFIGQPGAILLESFYEEGAGIYDAGEVALDAMTEPDSSLLSYQIPVVLNHSYWISTVDGDYYKLRVTDIDLSLDASSNATSITFEFEASGSSVPIVPGPETYNDWPAQTITDPNHNWTVEFSQNVNSATVDYNSIYVKNSSGQNLYLQTAVSGSAVTVYAPAAGYSADEQYYLYIEDTVKSSSQADLSGPVRMEFSVTAASSDEVELLGTVMDMSTGEIINGAAVEVYQNGTLVSTAFGGQYVLSLSAGDYQLLVSADGYSSVNQNVSVTANDTMYLPTVYLQQEIITENGSFSGYVTDAYDGTGIEGLTINFREGINVTSGEIVATATTDSSGYYLVSDLASGTYTGEISGSGYTSSYLTAYCVGGELTDYQNGTVTQFLSAGQVRIVLTWGETPSDLDSHFYGPMSSGERFHVYYSNMYDDWYDSNVMLDVDDTSSYGPETTTIYEQLEGIYTFSVYDYTNGGSTSSMALSNSGAKVEVYMGDTLARTYYVPSNQGGTLWKVFQLSGTTITGINTMSYDSPYTDDYAAKESDSLASMEGELN